MANIEDFKATEKIENKPKVARLSGNISPNSRSSSTNTASMFVRTRASSWNTLSPNMLSR